MKIPFEDRTTIVAAAVYAASIIISLLWFLVFPLRLQEQVLFFPDTVSGTLRGETRLMPARKSETAEVAQLIDELLLGPTAIHSTRLLPRGVSRESTLMREGTVYADLSMEAATQAAEIPLEEALVAIEKSILYNFRRVSTVVVTIGGQLPLEPPYENFQNNL